MFKAYKRLTATTVTALMALAISLGAPSPGDRRRCAGGADRGGSRRLAAVRAPGRCALRAPRRPRRVLCPRRVQARARMAAGGPRRSGVDGARRLVRARRRGTDGSGRPHPPLGWCRLHSRRHARSRPQYLRDRAGRESEAFDDVLSSKPHLPRRRSPARLHEAASRERHHRHLQHRARRPIPPAGPGARVEPQRGDEDRRARRRRHAAGAREAGGQRPRLSVAARMRTGVTSRSTAA